MRLLDRLSRGLALLAGWAYVAIGLMLAYEVAARYFFNAPTIWAEEVSRLVFVWASLIAAAGLLQAEQHIAVTVLTDRLGPLGRRLARLLALAFVLLFAALVVRYGTPIAVGSWERGRSAGTLLDLPNWWGQAAVPLAFLLVALQALVELLRPLAGAPLPARQGVGEAAGEGAEERAGD